MQITEPSLCHVGKKRRFGISGIFEIFLKYKANGKAHLKNCKQLFEYQHLLLHRDIWWSKF
jgi:hypothetical protein